MTGSRSGDVAGARVAAAVESTYRTEWTRVVAGLVRRYGDLDIAEETAAEAFATAAHRWRDDDLPANPGAWITTTAHRKAIDRLRREGLRRDKHQEALRLQESVGTESVGAVDDDRLRLLFTCCHPALSMESRVALTLRIVGGLTVAEIARAFLVRDTTMGQRISRAKSKIRTAGIPYRVPLANDLPERIDGVLTVLYLIFNEGYLSSAEGAAPIRRDLTAEAIRLARLVHELIPHDGEVSGVLALMLLTESRATARLTAGGELVRLDEQDRSLWDHSLIAEALELSGRAFASLESGGTEPGRYLLMAAINAEHISAPQARETDWSRIVWLYEQIEQIDPGPVVALNKAVAIAQIDHPEVALALLDRFVDLLAAYHPFHATRAELLREANRFSEAREAYDRAITLATNTAEIAHLTRRRGQLATSIDPDPREPPRLE